MRPKMLENGTEVHEKMEASYQVIIKTGECLGLAATAVIDNFDRGSDNLFDKVMWDIMDCTYLVSFCYEFYEFSI